IAALVSEQMHRVLLRALERNLSSVLEALTLLSQAPHARELQNVRALRRVFVRQDAPVRRELVGCNCGGGPWIGIGPWNGRHRVLSLSGRRASSFWRRLSLRSLRAAAQNHHEDDDRRRAGQNPRQQRRTARQLSRRLPDG